MLKVLIVDDEPFIRQGLKCLIDWGSEGYEIVAEADNGNAALELIREQKFDLVIADIKMPGMTGLELLEKVNREEISDAKFVILSGYFEYEYVKQAMYSKCSDYILKPVQKDELIKLLRRVSEDFDESKKSGDELKIREKALLNSRLRSIIWGKFDEHDLEYAYKAVGNARKLRYIGIEADASDEAYSALTGSEKRLAGRKLTEITERAIASDVNPVVFDVTMHEECYDIGIIYSANLAERAGFSEQEYFEALEKNIADQYKYKIKMYIGNRVDSLEKLSESFRSAVIAKSVFSDDGYEKETPLEMLDKEKLDRLISAVEQNDDEAIDRAVDEIYSCINNMDYRLITVNIDYILCHFIHMAQESDRNINQDEVMRYIRESSFNIGTIRGSKSHFKNFAADFSRYLSQLRSGSYSGLMADIKRDIDTNYAENISLRSLGEKYYVNSVYLGQIFKKQFDMTFKDYLNVVRIEEATKLIVSSNEKIQCIAEKVGYKSMDYFTKKFIAIKGMTPTKLRKRANMP